MPTAKTFLVIEESLSKRLRDTWEPIGARLARDILKAFKDDDYQALDKYIAKIQLERAMTGNIKYATAMGKSAVLFGASRLQPIASTRAMDESITKSVVGSAVGQITMVLEASSRTVRRQVRTDLNKERDRQVEDQQITKAELIESFASKLGETMVGGHGMIDLASSLHTSRLASFGFTVEATLIGQTTYRINAMLDSRTCGVCAHMDGRVFEVRTQHQTLLRVFEAKTVDDLKRAAPWPPQDKASLERMETQTSEEIQNMGYGSPPFHPLCRCYIDYDETPLHLIDENVAPVMSEVSLTPIKRPVPLYDEGDDALAGTLLADPDEVFDPDR